MSGRSWIATAVLVVIAGAALAAPWLGLPAPDRQPDPGQLSAQALQPPGSPSHLLGTDALGRDLLSRLIWGARISLAVGALAAVTALSVGGAVGLIAGLFGGWVDRLAMRGVDLFLALPRLFLVLLLVALWGQSLTAVVLLIGLTSWMVPARLVRGEVLSLKTRDYVVAARSSGASAWRIARDHLLPGALPPLLVEGALRVARAILLEASLSFVGLGLAPPAASWGTLIADGRGHVHDGWWIATFPGLMIVATVLALSLLSDRLRERLDPRTS